MAALPAASFGSFVIGPMAYWEPDAGCPNLADAALSLPARYSWQVQQAAPSSSSPTSLKSKKNARRPFHLSGRCDLLLRLQRMERSVR
jgi:hypothetical protein